MELLKYELYKIFSRKSIYIVFILMISITFLPRIISENQWIKKAYEYSQEELYNYLKQFEGSINKEKENKLKELVDENNKDKEYYKKSKYVYFNYMVQSRPRVIAISDILRHEKKPFKLEEYSYLNNDFKGYTMDELEESLSNLKNEGKKDTYDYKNKLLAKQMYEKLKQPEFKYAEVGSIIYDNNIIFAVLFGIMLSLGISPIFSEEYKDNVAPLILSSKKGRKNIVKVKIIASIIYSTLIVLLIHFMEILTTIKTYGIHGYEAPIQNMLGFINSPYNLSIGQFWGIYVLTSIIGAILFSLVIILVSQISKSSMITLFTSACILFYPIILKDIIPNKIEFKKALIDISITQILNVKGIYQLFSTINIFGKPILYPYFILIFSIILGGVLCLFIHNSVKKQEIS